MAMKKKYAVEDFLSDSGRLLDEIDRADSFINDLPTDTAEAVSKEIRRKSLESIEEAIDFRENGYAEISLSKDEMYAVAGFFPPSVGMEPLKTDDVAELLSDKQITQGVD